MPTLKPKLNFLSSRSNLLFTMVLTVLIFASIGTYLILSSKASPAIASDFNNDGTVNIFDLSILASNWNRTNATNLTGDANNDGTVNIFDLSILASQWGQSGTPNIVADHYVSKSGNDLNEGSASHPWLSLQKAANSVTDGEIVQIEAGIYNERVTIPIGASGSAGKLTKFIANGTVTVSKGFIINADYFGLTGFEITPGQAFNNDPELDQHNGQVMINASYGYYEGLNIHDTQGTGFNIKDDEIYNTINNFTINTVGSSGIYTASTYRGGAHHTTISNGSIAHHKGWAAIQLTGDYNTVDTVTITGGPSGTALGGIDGDGIRVNFSTGSIIRKVVIRDLWEWYNNDQHTDDIHMWEDVHDLLIDQSILGTWEPGPPPEQRSGLEQEIGPSQNIMVGTVPANAHVDFTLQNSLLLGSNSSTITTAKNDGATIDVRLFNNTFWAQTPWLGAVDNAIIRNNIFRSFYISPVDKYFDSDYNIYCWIPSRISYKNQITIYEGPHSIGTTYETRVDPNTIFINPDVSAATDYGKTADFRLLPTSPAVGRADPAYAPTYDISGVNRVNPPDIGAYKY